jgi:hypothetical protein
MNALYTNITLSGLIAQTSFYMLYGALSGSVPAVIYELTAIASICIMLSREKMLNMDYFRQSLGSKPEL